MAIAEQGDGWLSACDDAGLFLVPTCEMIDALVAFLRGLSDAPILEVAAGRGELAWILAQRGVRVIATDAHIQQTHPPVTRLAAGQAIERYRPVVVLGSFAPADSGVDEVVLAADRVQHYLVLNARIGGAFGSDMLWNEPGWSAVRHAEVSRWLVTRHDVWLSHEEVLQHGEMWHFARWSERNST
jgi:hypothetical protein